MPQDRRLIFSNVVVSIIILILLILCFIKIRNVENQTAIQSLSRAEKPSILYQPVSYFNEIDKLPEFVADADRKLILNITDLHQFTQSELYKHYQDNPIIRAQLELSKKDGFITVGEYYNIRQAIKDIETTNPKEEIIKQSIDDDIKLKEAVAKL